MRHYPRAWNRTLLFLVGVILFAGGIGLALAQLWPRATELWLQYGPTWNEQLQNLFDRTGVVVYGKEFSWITAVVAFAGVIAVIVLLATIFGQSGGRTREALNIDAADLRDSEAYDDKAAGTITFTTKFMDEYIRDQLEDETSITSVSVSNWRVKKDTALQLKIKVARGASPDKVFTAVERVSENLDNLFGHPLPILVHLVQGTAITESFATSAPRVV